MIINEKLLKHIKIVTANILLIVLALILLEVLVYTFDAIRLNRQHYCFLTKYNLPPYSVNISTFDKYYNENKMSIFRKPMGLNYNKRPVILFGCSYTYGTNLKENQTFSYKLSHQSHRPVFNRGIGGWGVQHMLYQLQNDNELDKISDPEIIVFTFFYDHIYRLYTYSFLPYDSSLYLKYEQKHGKLQKVNPKYMFLYKSYFIRCLDRTISNLRVHNNFVNKNAEILTFTKLLFEETYKEIKNKYPDTKFVLLLYAESDNWFIEKEQWADLESRDFIVVNTNDLTGKKLSDEQYKLFDGHPNEKAWDIIVPAFIKKLDL